MKNRFRIPLLILLSLIIVFSISCEILTPLDPDEKTEKAAWETIIEAHIMKQLWYYDFFGTYSDNYASGQLFVADPDKNSIDKLWDDFQVLMEYGVSVEAAVDSLENLPPPFGKAAVPAGIISSLKSFFDAGSEVYENNRKRLLLIASNMSKTDRDQLYEELVIDKWKREIGTADEFWSKLQNGDLDDKASTLYKNFYDGANAYLNPFTQLANDKNLTPGKMLAKDGINLCEKGMDVIVESGKSIVPGLEKASDLLEEGKDFYEKVEKITDKPMDAVVDEIKSRAAGKLADMIDIDSRLDPEGAGKYVKMVAELTLGSDDTQELIENGIDAGIAKISSSDGTVKTDYAIAENRDPAAGLPDYIIGIGNYVRNTQAFIMTLPSGDWDISAKEFTGKSSVPAVISVQAQQEATVDVSGAEIEYETGVLDSLLGIINDYNYLYPHIYLNDPGGEWDLISIYLYDDTVTWSGKFFSASEHWQSVPDENSVRYLVVDTEISGYLTMVGYDEVGVNLTATCTEKRYLVSSNELKYLDVEEIEIRGLPFSRVSSGQVDFEVSPNINSDELNDLNRIVNFSRREVVYGEYNLSGGDVYSDTTYTEIQDLSRAQMRVTFRYY
ncbi:MAG: hypothetical protein PHT46_05120 [Candidatus Marinimicrobia bacterium]|nr:hypothetical protein [Candidatus Neomarinimicrobiota bacterium]MDD5710467.1 hypothetical protein [Candidatus Neomarinimicrobiota bacterium]